MQSVQCDHKHSNIYSNLKSGERYKVCVHCGFRLDLTPAQELAKSGQVVASV